MIIMMGYFNKYGMEHGMFHTMETPRVQLTIRRSIVNMATSYLLKFTYQSKS
jgi:hypothetical protein